MIHEDYKHVGRKYSLYDVPKIVEVGSSELIKGKELYQSIYRFGEDVLSYKSLGNLKKGIKFYSDYLVFDIDSKNLQKAHEHMVNLTEQLSVREIGFETWFSGHKGFHVKIPTCQFEFEPTDDANQLKNIATELANTWNINIDEKIYNVTRVLRVPGSINKKSGLYKVPVTPSMPIEEVLEFAKEPRDNPYPEPDDYGKNEILLKVYRHLLDQPKINRVILPSEEPKKGRSLFSKVKEGDRNEGLYKLARSLARRSINEADALFICGAWNRDMLEKPIEARELQKTVISAYTKGMNEMVDESSYKDHFFDVHRSLNSAKRLIANLKDTIIRTGFPFIDNYTMGLFKGDMIFILARPGNYKTCILSSILQSISQTTKKKTLFFSMEMNPDRLNLRHMQASEGMSQKEVVEALKAGHEFNKYQEDYMDVSVIGLSSLSIEMVLGMIDWYLEEKGDVGAIGFDYLSLFRGCANNTEATARVATELKTRVAKAANCPVFCLVQAKREYEGHDGDIEIDKQAGKDSSSIEDSGDYLIGVWRHDGNRYARFLKSRAFNSGEYYENPYMKLEIHREHMSLKDFNHIDWAEKPTFNQVKRGRD